MGQNERLMRAGLACGVGSLPIAHDARVESGPRKRLVAGIRQDVVDEERRALARQSEQGPAAGLDANAIVDAVLVEHRLTRRASDTIGARKMRASRRPRTRPRQPWA